MKLRFNQNGLKLIAIFAMTIDHLAWAFVPTASLLGQIMHFIGRLTAVLMCYFLAEGYLHTHHFGRYLKRLLLFAVLAQIPFLLFNYGCLPSIFPLNMLFTLALALGCIWCCDHYPGKDWIFVTLFALLSGFGDWAFLGVLYCYGFWKWYDNPGKSYAFFFLINLFDLIPFILYNGISSIFQLGVLVAPLLLKLYNHQRGTSKIISRFFYWYYPVHLVILYLLMISF